jgi:Bromodomain
MAMSRELSELALWERPKREPTQVTTPSGPRRSSASADTPRPVAASHTSTPLKSTFSNDFVSKCKHIITELQKPKHLEYITPFLAPVDWQALNIPEYPDIIKHPMDLSTVDKNLANGRYQKLDEFVADMRLIFNNCYTFNRPGDPVYDMGKRSEKLFDKLLEKTISEGSTSTSSMQNGIYLNGEREASSADAESRKRKPISYAEEEDKPSEGTCAQCQR